MTLILEYENRLIFYRRGILRYAMGLARMALRQARDHAERSELLSRCLKRGWADAKAQLAGYQRARDWVATRQDEGIRSAARRAALQDAIRFGSDADRIRAALLSETMRDRMDFAAVARLEAALAAVLAPAPLH